MPYRDVVASPGPVLDVSCAFLGVAPGIISQVPAPRGWPGERIAKLVVRGEVEPSAFSISGAYAASLDVAGGALVGT